MDSKCLNLACLNNTKTDEDAYVFSYTIWITVDPLLMTRRQNNLKLSPTIVGFILTVVNDFL